MGDLPQGHSPQLCPYCRQPISDDAPQGVCGACLFAAAKSPLNETSSPQPAHFPVFSGLVVLNLLNSGGMGQVWLAYDPELDRSIAIKLFRHFSDTNDERWTESLQQELRIVSQLRHPSLVTVYHSVRTDDGIPGFAMEWIDGPQLDQWIAERSNLTLDDKLTIFRRIVSGVAYLHEHGTIHRDLKPANILVQAEDQPKIIDFGLARLEESAATQASLGAAGTMPFMAPEQAANEAGSRATPVDVYALGLILHWLVTGRWLIEPGGTQAEVLAQVLNPPSCRPRKLAPHLPKDLESIIRKALSPDPHLRYRTAIELEADLDNLSHKRPVSARKLTFRYLLLTFLRRQTRRSALAAAIVLLGLIAGGAMLWNYRHTAAQNEANLRLGYSLMNSGMRKLRDELRSLTPSTAPADGLTAEPTPEDVQLPVDGKGRLDLRSSSALLADIQSATLQDRYKFQGALNLSRRALDLYSDLSKEAPDDPSRLMDATMARLSFAKLLEKTDKSRYSAEQAEKTIKQLDILQSLTHEDGELRSRARFDALRLQALYSLNQGQVEKTFKFGREMLSVASQLPQASAISAEVEDRPRLAQALDDLIEFSGSRPALLKEITPQIDSALHYLREERQKQPNPALTGGLIVGLHAHTQIHLLINHTYDPFPPFRELLELCRALPKGHERSIRPLLAKIIQSIVQWSEKHLNEEEAVHFGAMLDTGHQFVNLLRSRGDDTSVPVIARAKFYDFQSQIHQRQGNLSEAGRCLQLAIFSIRARQARYPDEAELAIVTAHCLKRAEALKSIPTVEWTERHGQSLKRILTQLEEKFGELTEQEQQAAKQLLTPSVAIP